MWPSAIGAPQRKRRPIGQTGTMSKLLTLVEAMINDVVDAVFVATVNCHLAQPFQTIPCFRAADSLRLKSLNLSKPGAQLPR